MQNNPGLKYSGMISNAGQFSTTLTNVLLILDNGTPANTNDDAVFFVGTLTNGQTATYSNFIALPSHTTTNTVVVRGTDELGLTVWDTNQCVIPLGTPVPIDPPQITRPGYLRLQWSSVPGTSYQIQAKDDVGECFWKNLPFILPATATNTIVDVVVSGVARFFRVVQVE